MRLVTLALHNFRNIKSSVFSIGEQLTVFIGDNAQGKTNCLESIYFLTYGTGFRESKEEELVLAGNKAGAYVEGIFTDGDMRMSCKAGLVRSETGYRKSFFINKTKKQLRQYRQESRGVVLFAPEQIEMLTGSPDRRRSYFNKLISQFDLQYKKHLESYERAVRRRNKILEHYEYVDKLRSEIAFWNELCLQDAQYLTKVRAEYCDFLNRHQHVDGRVFQIRYVRNEFSREQLAKYAELELQTRRTMFGPQKDEFLISLSDKNVQHFGSRSEQRLALMWLKLAEISYFQEIAKFHPILLLDDIFSEFDATNKELILSLVKQNQTVATTTDHEIVTIAKKHKIPTKVISL